MAIIDAKDVTISTLRIDGEKLSANIADAITDVTLDRTLDGAPTLNIEFEDPRHVILQSGFFAQKGLTAQVDGKGFELAAMKKQSQKHIVVFEDLAVAEMRKHTDNRGVKGGTMTRVQFAQLLLSETPWIPLYVAPGVTEQVAQVALARGYIATADGSTAGDPTFYETHGVQSTDPTAETNSIVVAQAALAAGFSGNDLVTAVAIAQAESGLRAGATNKNTNGSTDYGLWQINSVHAALLKTGDWRNPVDNAKMAYSLYKGKGGKFTDWVTFNNGAYRKFLTNGQFAVSKIGVDTTALSASQQNSEAKKAAQGALEDTWSCLKRIFGAVGWRVYTDWNSENIASVYVGPDSAFIATPAEINITEQSEGIDTIDWDFDRGKAAATATVKGRSTRWQLPPGTPVNLTETGLPNPWMVARTSRSLFSVQVTATLKRPEPEFPEPLPTNADGSPIDLGQYITGNNGTSGGGVGGGQYVWPVNGSHPITSPFGGARGHKGLDIGVGQGTPVFASRAGTVTRADGTWDPKGYGNVVIIKHDGGDETRYGHLSSFNCRNGMVVKQGQQIGLSGGKPGTPGAGDATGPHLHFEIRKNGVAVDPQPLLTSLTTTTSPFTSGSGAGGGGGGDSAS